MNLSELRKLATSPQRILCTGNPDREYTIASAVRALYPAADFISSSTGYDLTGDLTEFKNKLGSYNVLINASHIRPGTQLNILNACSDVWRYGHVINIGSSSEYNPDTYSSPEYARAKLALRNRSLELNTYRFRTTHIVLGGLHTSRPGTDSWLEVAQVADVIKWVLTADFNVPIIGVEPTQTPW